MVTHELVHRTERHHTRRFWEALERALPDCRAREAELECDWHTYVAFEVTGQTASGTGMYGSGSIAGADSASRREPAGR